MPLLLLQSNAGQDDGKLPPAVDGERLEGDASQKLTQCMAEGHDRPSQALLPEKVMGGWHAVTWQPQCYYIPA